MLLAAEHANAGAPSGMIVSTGALAPVTAGMTEVQFPAWGRRMPFLFSFALNVRRPVHDDRFVVAYAVQSGFERGAHPEDRQTTSCTSESIVAHPTKDPAETRAVTSA